MEKKFYPIRKLVTHEIKLYLLMANVFRCSLVHKENITVIFNWANLIKKPMWMETATSHLCKGSKK